MRLLNEVANLTTRVDLTEYRCSSSVKLSASQRDGLREAVQDLVVEPTPREEGLYNLTPQSTVGAIEVDGLSLVISPKIGITQVLSLAIYAMAAEGLQPKRRFSFEADSSLPDMLAIALAQAAQNAFGRGLLRGYRQVEESLFGVRGRIRIDDQLRRRQAMPLPLEVRYDEFTEDILENRLIRAAASLLVAVRLESPVARRGMGWLAGTLADVAHVEFSPTDVPEVHLDRLNQHYGNVIALSRMILRHSAFQSRRGGVRATGFLFDMNDVFQKFVTRAFREALGTTEAAFGEKRTLSLDIGGYVHLKPDLVWRRDGRVVFVGDAKYKDLSKDYARESDIYQLLAYSTALDLPGGLLIYAKSASDHDHSGRYVVRHSGKRLVVSAVDMAGDLEDILKRVKDLTQEVRQLTSA